MAMFLTRALLFNLIIANLYHYPFAQSILINILTILMFSYLVVKRPLKNLLELVQLFLNEILVIIVNVCVLIIAIMDKAGIKGQELRDGVCETVMKIIIIFSSSALAFIALQILISLYFFYKLLKSLKAEGKLSFSGVLKVWFDGEETKEMRDKEEKKHSELIPTADVGRRRYKKVNRNLSLFDSQIQEKRITPVLRQAPEIKKEVINNTESERTLNHSHFDPFKKSLISEASLLNLTDRTREDLKDNSLFESSRLMMESNNRNKARVVPIDALDFSVNQKKKTSLAQMVGQDQERRNYLRRFGIMNFQEKYLNNEERK